MTKKKRLGELLKEKGLINDTHISVAIAQQKITGTFLGETLIDLGFVSAKEISEALAEQAGLEYIDLREYPISEEALRLVPKDVAQRGEFIPIELRNGTLVIGVIDPSNILAIDTISRIMKSPPVVYMVDSEAYYYTIEKAYFFLENPVQKQIEETVELLKNEVLSARISRLTELIIMDAIGKNATDIHITPAEHSVHVFYRIDGILQQSFCFPKQAHSAMVSKIKVMSGLDIAEQRLPQDGSFTFNFLAKNYDMRISTAPTIHGENVVIRVLSGSGPLTRLEALGFDPEETKKLRLIFKKPYGIILITGPTGSGKTTTLYAALREVNLLEKNVLTIEDPVEYRLSLVRQAQINLKAGYDFAIAGRTFMRQDPDVILLGEIRDKETALIAVRASVTGHLVLSTLHTNDAVTSIPRLQDLGVDNFMLASSLFAVVAQRLVRKICPFCKETYKITEQERLSIEFSGITEWPEEVHRGKGCSTCKGSGYMGRTVIGEIFIVDDDIKGLINEGASTQAIKEKALEKGMKTLLLDGIRKVRLGITTIEEVLRVAG